MMQPVYEVQLPAEELKDIEILGDKTLSVWDGTKNENGIAHYQTDGFLLFHRTKAADTDLRDRLLDHPDEDSNLQTHTVNQRVKRLQKGKSWVGKLRGVIKNPDAVMLPPHHKHAAVVSYRNYKEDCMCSPYRFKLAQRLAGPNSKLRVNQNGSLFWVRDDAVVAAIGTFAFYSCTLKS